MSMQFRFVLYALCIAVTSLGLGSGLSVAQAATETVTIDVVALPAPSGDADAEYISFTNTGGIEADLSSYNVYDDNAEIGSLDSIAAGDSYVLCRDISAVESRHSLTCDDTFSPNLNNGGDSIIVKDGPEGELLNYTYPGTVNDIEKETSFDFTAFVAPSVDITVPDPDETVTGTTTFKTEIKNLGSGEQPTFQILDDSGSVLLNEGPSAISGDVYELVVDTTVLNGLGDPKFPNGDYTFAASVFGLEGGIIQEDEELATDEQPFSIENDVVAPVTLQNPVPADGATVSGVFDIQIEVTGDIDSLRDGGPVTVSLFDMSSSDGDGTNDYFAFLATTSTSVWEVTGIDSTDPTVGIDDAPLNDGEYRMEIQAIGEGDVQLDNSVTHFTILNDGDDSNGSSTPDEGVEPVYGCIDEEALNYDPDATHDDEGCEYAEDTLPEQCLAGNLLDNGSFEAPVIDTGYTFISNPASWLVVMAATGDAADLEFQRDWQGNEAAAGAQYVELDGNESVTISQEAAGLEVEAEYTLFWDFAARQNTAAANNNLSVALDGATVATSGPAAGSGVIARGDWLADSYTFTATTSTVDVSFTDIGTDDSFGTFLDDAVLCKTAPAPEPETWTFEGYKYRDETGAGELGEGLVGEPNWGMELVLNNDGAFEVLATTTTGADGYYEFILDTDEVPEGANFSNLAVREENRTDWTPTGVYADGTAVRFNSEEVLCGAFYQPERPLLDDDIENDLPRNMDYLSVMPDSSTVQCDFLNQPPEETEEENDDEPVTEEEDEDDGTTYGTRVRRTPQPEPQVLGAATSTDAAPQCGRLLSDYMRLGEDASERQIQLLQIFLNGQGYLVPVTGEFDAATDKAVRDFQEAHHADVLTPWYEAGLMDHENPTGYVYRTTRWKINNIVCPDSEPFPELR